MTSPSSSPESAKALADRALVMAEKATPGPWRTEGEDCRRSCVVESAHYEDEEPGICGNHSKYWALLDDDAAFIAESRTLVPELARALLAANEENEALRDAKRSADALFNALWQALGDDAALKALGLDRERIRIAEQEIRNGKFVKWEDLRKELTARSAPGKGEEDGG